MKQGPLLLSILTVFFILWLFLISPGFCQDSSAPADIVIKVGRVEKLLEIIDKTAQSMNNQGQAAPSMFLRSMLQGTDWIDPERAIVIGAVFNPAAEKDTSAAALIPFRKPNENFKTNYNAIAGSDYYIFALPPGQGGVVSDPMEEALITASLSAPEGLVSADIAAARLIDKAEPQIKAKLQKLGQQVAQAPETDMDPEQTKQMLSALIETGRQVRRLSFGMDSSKGDFVFFFNIGALANSRLAEVFKSAGEDKDLLLADYTRDYPVHFRSKPYDVNAVMDLLDTHFGPLYQQMGIDFGKLTRIMQYFSGEAAGGIAFDSNGVTMEVIAGLDEKQEVPQDYLETVYIPWLLDYGQAMADYLNEQSPEIKLGPLFQPMPASEVAGHSVNGVRFNMPSTGPEPQMDFEFEMRMTRLDSMILMASDDDRLERLIDKAKHFEKRKAGGPFMEMDIDLDAYLGGIYQLMPDQVKPDKTEIPELGDLTYTLDMAGEKLESRYTVAIADVQKMASYFKALSVQAAEGRGEDLPTPQREDAAPPEEKRTTKAHARNQAPVNASPDKDDPQYWLNKGQLFATYGNVKRAVEHFRKAAEMDPENSLAFFHLGLSYGDNGQYSKAMDAINRAISLKPSDGDYYYARGWIRMLAGNRDQAVADMKRAAQLNDPDAIAYLESINTRSRP